MEVINKSTAKNELDVKDTRKFSLKPWIERRSIIYYIWSSEGLKLVHLVED